MPRLAPRLFRSARATHPHLAKLLPVCRDWRSAENELRWIRESVRNTADSNARHASRNPVSQLVNRRGHGEPLQYVLGSEFFGEIELKCRPGVLIPRLETAASVTHLVDLIATRSSSQLPRTLRVLDFCTGTGCIPLLFHDEFYKHPHVVEIGLDFKGYDISQNAIDLASENRALQLERPENQSRRNAKWPSGRVESLQAMELLRYDVLAYRLETDTNKYNERHGLHTAAVKDGRLPGSDDHTGLPKCDVLISNPPYISPSDYKRTIARSVRRFEPKLALVPPSTCYGERGGATADEDKGDEFYPRLLDLAERTSAKLVLLEVADIEQAKRVVSMVLQRSHWNIGVEIWRDEPSRARNEATIVGDKSVNVVGEGNGRSVFIWRTGSNVLASGYGKLVEG